ncbi:MAG: YidB family protein [Steroidobacteraceae bacterium]|jgi:uncharacterized protein YidB (DUF937 family)
MGLLDSALGSLLSPAQGGGQSQVTQVLGNLLQQHGGLGGLVTQLSQGGLGSQVSSWIGNGQNQPVSASQITQALGGGTIARIAQELGLDPQQAGNIVAQVLPHLIDHLTPAGQLPTNAAQTPSNAVLAQAVSAIAAKLLH